MKARERREIAGQLANHAPDSDPLLIVGTSSFIKEGFDCPALDTSLLTETGRITSVTTGGRPTPCATPGHQTHPPPSPRTTTHLSARMVGSSVRGHVASFVDAQTTLPRELGGCWAAPGGASQTSFTGTITATRYLPGPGRYPSREGIQDSQDGQWTSEGSGPQSPKMPNGGSAKSVSGVRHT